METAGVNKKREPDRTPQPAGDEDHGRFESLVNSIDGIVWEADADTFAFTFVSKQAERILGFPAERWTSDPDFWSSNLHPDDRDGALGFCIAAARRKEDHQLEYRMIAADGRVVWLRDMVTVRAAKGSPVRLSGVMMDITERKRAEHELLRTSERLHLATTAAGIGIWDWDVVKDELVWDDAMYRLLGVSKDTFGAAYETWAGTLVPEDLERTTAELRSALAGERDFDSDFRITWPDGSVRFIQAGSQTFRDEAGTPVRMVGVNYDITKRKLAEENLRLSEERLRLLFDSTAEGIFGVDVDGRCTFCNAAGVRLLGYDHPSELVGQEMHTLIAHSHADGAPYPLDECPVVRSLRDATSTFSDRDVFWKKDGTSFPTEYSSYPMFQDGEHRGSVITFLDITDRRAAAAENRRLMHEMGERVKELTALHRTAHVLQNEASSIAELLQEIVALLPQAWQYPEIAAGRIRFGDLEFCTAGFTATPWSQTSAFTAAGVAGEIEVVYLEPRPREDLGPFSSEEKRLINSLGEMISSALKRRYAQEELRESQRRFSDTLTNLEMIAVMADATGNITFCNDYLLRLTGWELHEAVGRNWFEMFIPEQEKDRVTGILGEVPDQGLVAPHFENEIKTRSGERRMVKWTNTTLRDLDGKFIGIAAVGDDVTETKRAEEQIKTTSEQLRALTVKLRRAQEEEGTRIAREIHDELGSALTSLKWELEAIDKSFFRPDGPLPVAAIRERVAGMTSLIDSTVNVVRRISSELRPSILDDLGLGAALEWQAEQFQTRTGIECHCDCSLEGLELNREQATAVFRIFQEALTNVLRHARATRVDVSMEQAGTEFMLTISDNGRGITEKEKAESRSLGLLGIRERAFLIGGRIDIQGTEGKGTVITVHVPLVYRRASAALERK